MSQRTTRPRPRVHTLMMAFHERERLPERGDTVIMAGSYGVRYAVTVQRIIARERRADDHTILLTVKATRRAITETESAG